MIASYHWLKDYINTDVSPQELAEKMVMTGNGVESITNLGENMEKVVVGRIVKLEKHPDADKLQICQIDVGDQDLLQIVTGADNVFEGALVPVALSGSKLPNGVKIKKGKLRGVASYGMLCSGEELCLKEEDYPGAGVYGILILQGDWAPGTDMKEVLMQDDTVIEFEVGANRPDCLSMLGIAREAAAALDIPVKIPEPAFSENQEKVEDYVSVQVDAPDLCPRYLAKAVKNVKIAPSPLWMQRRLRAAGVRPINNIVDITNFVMLETGQPMHAYDAQDIRGGKIVVRRAQDGETMTTLDGKERSFTSSMLLITDGEGPIGIAGIMGGEDSEIKDTTQTVIFEAAKFMYGNIRQTARSLGMATEASMRFSKGVDAVGSEFAIRRACQLVEELGAGEIVGGTIDQLAVDLTPRVLKNNATDINHLLGTQISAVEMKRCLDRVFIKTELDGTILTSKIPSFREDIVGRADIAEEVARIYGYDNIPANEVKGEIMRRNIPPFEGVENALKYFMVSSGFFECVTYSFLGDADFDRLNLPADHHLRKAVRIKNPLGDDSCYMRTTLIPSIMNVMALNLNRKNKDVKVFEMGKAYIPEQVPLNGKLPDEREKLVFAMSGEGVDFYTLKQTVENVYEVMRIQDDIDVVTGGEVYFHPGRRALMYSGDKLVGQLGEVHPDVLENYGITERVYLAQMDLTYLLSMVGTRVQFKALPKYPALERDIAIVVDKMAESGTIRKHILKYGGRYIEKVELFDVYQGAQLGKDKKSLAYSLTFRSSESTLTDEAIQKDMQHILEMLEKEFDAKLRD